MIGNILKKERNKKKWSQRYLAKLSGIHFSYISRLEKSYIKKPEISTLYKIARALNVPIETFPSEAIDAMKGIKHGSQAKRQDDVTREIVNLLQCYSNKEKILLAKVLNKKDDFVGILNFLANKIFK